MNSSLGEVKENKKLGKSISLFLQTLDARKYDFSENWKFSKTN